jgi:hypothetical protein
MHVTDSHSVYEHFGIVQAYITTVRLYTLAQWIIRPDVLGQRTFFCAICSYFAFASIVLFDYADTKNSMKMSLLFCHFLDNIMAADICMLEMRIKKDCRRRQRA